MKDHFGLRLKSGCPFTDDGRIYTGCRSLITSCTQRATSVVSCKESFRRMCNVFRGWKLFAYTSDNSSNCSRVASWLTAANFKWIVTINVHHRVNTEETCHLFHSAQPRVSHQCGQIWSLGRVFPGIDDAMQNYSSRTTTTNLHLRQMSTKSRISLLNTRPGSRGGG